MTRRPGVSPRAGRPREREDAGITLIELMVSMSIMSIFLAMFTAGVLAMYRSANKTESSTIAQSNINLPFLRLDKEIRYAAGISTPGAVGPNQYVEYLTTNTGSPVCTELRLNVSAKQLQRRTWPQGVSPVTPTPWIPLASAISSAQPFTFSDADATFNFQRLKLTLLATSGSGNTATAKESAITFTALNTSLTTNSDTICSEGRSIP